MVRHFSGRYTSRSSLELLDLQRRVVLGILALLMLTANFAASPTRSLASGSYTITTPDSQMVVATSTSNNQFSVNASVINPHQISALTNSKAYTWGNNGAGQLGNGSTTNSSVPVAVTLPSGVISFSDIGGGNYHSLALANNGRLYAWGYNAFGQLGNGTTTTVSTLPVTVSLPTGVTSFTSFSTGGEHNIAFGNDGKLYAWGANNDDQLGNSDAGVNSRVPVTVTLPSGVTSYSRAKAGGYHNLAFGNDGKLYAWGKGNQGQLGNGTNVFSSATPVTVSLPSGVVSFTSFSAGAYHNLAKGSDGKLYGWGQGGNGQLGQGTNTSSNVPVPVILPPGVTSFTKFMAGSLHSLALGDDGKLYAWGYNGNGGLGTGFNSDSSVPILVTLPAGVASFTDFTAGYANSLAVGNDGKLYAWGLNNYGQLGNGTTTDSNVPVLVNGPSGLTPTVLSIGAAHSLVIFTSASITGGFHPLPQFRLYDSRASAGGPGPFAAGETRTITAVNNTGVPANSVTNTVRIPATAKSIVVNFTGIQVSKGGFLTAYQTGITRPTISTLNWYYANQIVANSAIVDLNGAGQFDAYFGASAGDLTVDVIGYIDNQTDGPAIPPTNPLSGVLTTTALTYKPVSPSITNVRAYDSRVSSGGPGPLASGVTRTVQIRGIAGVPNSAKAVIINLTAIGAVNRGFLAAYTGNSNPGTASVSFNGSVQPVVGNLVVAYLDSAGAITMLAGGSAASSDFAIDVFGYYDNSDLSVGGYVGLAAPVRHYDSRTSSGGSGPISAGTTISAAVSTKLGTATPTGVPANARAVVIHLAVVNTVSNGFLALYGVSYQGTSSLNWAGNGQLVSNLAVVDLNQLDNLKVRAGGNAAAKADFIIDIVGYIP